MRRTDSTTCFAKGTLITTDNERIAIEDLRPGDLVLTATNGYKPVRWIGWRTVDLASFPEVARRRNQPVFIRASALGCAIPCQDLVLSAGHAIVVSGKLIAAGTLLSLKNPNIVALQDLPVVTYYHLECDEFEIIYANDVPAESFVDVGNRHAFDQCIGLPPQEARHRVIDKTRVAQFVKAAGTRAGRAQGGSRQEAGELAIAEL
jgi:Hint domain